MTESRTVQETARRVIGGEQRAREICASALERAHEASPRLRALRAIQDESAMRQAQEVDARVHRGEADLCLAGACVVIKDNVAQQGVPNLAGRRDGVSPPAGSDARLVARLRRAGAVILGRANMDELAYGVTGSNPHTGQVGNPRRLDHHPGGSSAGSAAAVAAGIAPLAIGSDTAGSIRIPASLCGVVGLKPTHGRCPTEGVAPLAPSLDCVGPLGACVRDVALAASVLLDDSALALEASRAGSAAGLRAAVIAGAFAVPPSPDVAAAFESALQRLARAGLGVEREVRLPELEQAPRTSGPIIGAEAALAWSREMAGDRAQFGDEVVGYLDKGAKVLAVRYLQAQLDRARLAAAIDALLRAVDVLLLPATASAATPASAPGPQLAFLALTVPFSLSGHPVLSVPMGEAGGLPVGMQIVGRAGREDVLLRVGAAFEDAA